MYLAKCKVPAQIRELCFSTVGKLYTYVCTYVELAIKIHVMYGIYEFVNSSTQ